MFYFLCRYIILTATGPVEVEEEEEEEEKGNQQKLVYY